MSEQDQTTATSTDCWTSVQEAIDRVRADPANRSDEEKVMAREIERLRPTSWQHMDEAPRDGTEIEVWVPSKHGLPGFIGDCAWHPDAGFCVDELREPVAWRAKE